MAKRIIEIKRRIKAGRRLEESAVETGKGFAYAGVGICMGIAGAVVVVALLIMLCQLGK